jgi:hypothetical protein
MSFDAIFSTATSTEPVRWWRNDASAPSSRAWRDDVDGRDVVVVLVRIEVLVVLELVLVLVLVAVDRVTGWFEWTIKAITPTATIVTNRYTGGVRERRCLCFGRAISASAGSDATFSQPQRTEDNAELFSLQIWNQDRCDGWPNWLAIGFHRLTNVVLIIVDSGSNLWAVTHPGTESSLTPQLLLSSTLDHCAKPLSIRSDISQARRSSLRTSVARGTIVSARQLTEQWRAVRLGFIEGGHGGCDTRGATRAIPDRRLYDVDGILDSCTIVTTRDEHRRE